MIVLGLSILFLAGVLPFLAVTLAGKGWLVRVPCFLAGIGLHVTLSNLIIKAPPLQDMIWSGPDAPAIFISFITSLLIIGGLSLLLYKILAPKSR